MNVQRLPVLAAFVAMVACRQASQRNYEYMPDMTYSVAYDSYAPNPITRDRKTMQAPVEGTIPRGFPPLHYSRTAADAERAGRELSNPIPTTPASLKQGQALFETYCLVCHGRRGDGDGPLVPKIPNPPAYSSARVRAMRPGQLFHVMTYGSGRMPSYAAQLRPDDRWLVAAYVETLQHPGGGR